MICFLIINPATEFDAYLKKQKKTSDLAWTAFVFWLPISLIIVGPLSMYNDGLEH